MEEKNNNSNNNENNQTQVNNETSVTTNQTQAINEVSNPQLVNNTSTNTQNNVKSENKDYDNDANISLILGILSLVLSAVPIVNLVLAIIAIVKANKIPKEERSGKSKAGLVMGIITIILSVISFVLIIIMAFVLGIAIFNAAGEVSNYGSNIYNSILDENESGYSYSQSYDYTNDIFNLYELTENEVSNDMNSIDTPQGEEETTSNSSERIFKNKESNVTYKIPTIE